MTVRHNFVTINRYTKRMVLVSSRVKIIKKHKFDLSLILRSATRIYTSTYERERKKTCPPDQTGKSSRQENHGWLLKSYRNDPRDNYRITLCFALKYFERRKTYRWFFRRRACLAHRREECDTDACRGGKSRSKNSCLRSGGVSWQNFRVRRGTFRRIYLNVSFSSAPGRNMGIKFVSKSSRFIPLAFDPFAFIRVIPNIPRRECPLSRRVTVLVDHPSRRVLIFPRLTRFVVVPISLGFEGA